MFEAIICHFYFIVNTFVMLVSFQFTNQILYDNMLLNTEEITMQEINERFIQLRKKLNMSQEEIGNVIGTKRSGVSNIENGIRNVTEKHIKLLCYGPINGQYINENWLRTGEGGDENMFLKPQKNELGSRAAALLGEKDPVFEAFVETYSSLTPANRKVLLDFSLKLLNALNDATNE